MSEAGARSNSFHYTVEAVEGALYAPRYELCPVRPRASYSRTTAASATCRLQACASPSTSRHPGQIGEQFVDVALV